MAETVVKTTAGRIPVFIHTGALATKDTIRLSKHALDIGADGVGVVTPSFFGINDDTMVEYYTEVSKSLPEDFPIYLYSIPQCSTNDITPEVCSKLVETCPNIVGIKYSGGDPGRVMEYLKNEDYDFSVLVGADRLFFQYLISGCDGTVSGCAGVFPEIFVSIYDAYKKGDMEEALQLQRKASNIIDILKAGTNISYFKEALALRGLPKSHMRHPLMDISDLEIEDLKVELSAYI
ncbi:dihydrodipicolinate synthase family protein [Alkalibacter mobilis]|uniref:dihydrodipicolinate synthase family protein n=1 Tax=Alkalibacter mobilis TaxID=2787712 RepID=UPI00189E3A07|nr:dihydrodipicolinate synthase family protein [Alkalibacter mobilis]